jgi:selenocysteine-specific elongation factor
LFFAGLHPWDAGELPRSAGVTRIEATVDALREQGRLIEVATAAGRPLRLHRFCLDRLTERIAAALVRLHDAYPLQSSFPLSMLEPRFRDLDDPSLLAAALQRMRGEGRVRQASDRVALADRGPQLSRAERKLLGELVERYRRAELQAPSVDDCRRAAGRAANVVSQLLKLACADGELVEIAPELYLHTSVVEAVKRRVLDELASGNGLTVGQIREMLGTTRKFAVPLCEYFDRIGLTQRQGDLRVAASRSGAGG